MSIHIIIQYTCILPGYIVYNLLFTITINIEKYYFKTINTRWLYKIIRLH